MRRVRITETVTNREHPDYNQPYEFPEPDDDLCDHHDHYCTKTTTITEFYEPLKPPPPIIGAPIQPNLVCHGPIPRPPSANSTFLPPPPPYSTMFPYVNQPEMSFNAFNGSGTIGPEGPSHQQPRCQGIFNTFGAMPSSSQICPPPPPNPPPPLVHPLVCSPSSQPAPHPDYQRLNTCHYNSFVPVSSAMPMSVPHNRMGFVINPNNHMAFGTSGMRM
ncbi:hypothetical protein Aperf_G00000077735 [Anoplocephala perfoliata]